MDFIFPDLPGLPDTIGALSTTRIGGVSHAPYDDGVGGGGLNLGSHVKDRWADVQQNRLLLKTMLPSEPAWLSQVHGVNVVNAAGIEGVPEADASFTAQPGVVCIIQTADCLPVLFSDTAGKVVAAAHAGWRGLANGVLENTIAAMRNAGAGDITAWLGPAIGPERFEVGEDVVAAFVTQDSAMKTAFQAIDARPGKYLADIYRLARMRLLSSGVKSIHGGGFCTVTDTRFYSYRRDKVTGRMASMIWIK